MSRYTRLERVAMDALTHDLRAEIPDLAGQFEESQLSQRRNSGFGLFTEMIVNRNRPVPTSGPTGDLGTVHIMVGLLSDPIAFKVRVRNGVLLGLMGDSYGQDTRAIDFATITFDQVFTVNAQGQSVPFEPTRQMSPGPLLDLQRHKDHRPPTRPIEPPPLVGVSARKRVQTVDAPARQIPTTALSDTLVPDAAPQIRIPTDQMSLLLGLWALIGVIGLLLVFVFRLPLALAVFFAIFAGRAVKQASVLSAVRKVIDNWQMSRVMRPD